MNPTGRKAALLGGLAASMAVTASSSAQVQSFPSTFAIREMPTNGTTLHVRVGGAGPAVVLLHGYAETGDMWAPLAVRLMRTHTVIIPDLRGMGLSAHPPDGYDKKNEARDLAGILSSMRIDTVAIVAHDIGNMVAYAFAAEHPTQVTKLVMMDAPLPGIGPWEEILKSPMLWHFHFGGPDMERLVKGRERIYLDRFWNELSANPKAISDATRRHYAELYALPGAMHSGFEQFKAFDQDAIDNKAFAARGPLRMPVLAVGGDKSFDDTMATVMRAVATNVTPVVIPNSGHWLMEENPNATIAAIMNFLK